MKTHNSQTEENIFHETQRFNQWWLWGLLILIQAIVLFAVTMGGDTSLRDVFYLPAFVPLILMALFFFVRLETVIDERGISYRWRPFMSDFKTFEWANIREASVLEYSALVGYGLRFSVKHGTVHNTSGTRGIQLVLKNGAKYMIGTQKPDEARQAIERFLKPQS